MKKVPYWAQGVFFSIAFILLIFFLKVICPIDLGCVVDPFLVPLFSPLKILSFFNLVILEQWEALYILIFWAFVGLCVGFVYEKTKGSLSKYFITEDDEETEESPTNI